MDWPTVGSYGEEFDKYIVVSFVNATIVLSIGEMVSLTGLRDERGTPVPRS